VLKGYLNGLPTWKVCLIGAITFTFSTLYLYFLGIIMTRVITTSAQLAFSAWWPQGLKGSITSAVAGVIAWPTVATAQKCHEILKARLFG
jgi:hypothetical protein